MFSTSMRYQILTNNPERFRATIESEASVKRETAYFRENIGKVTNADDLMKDYRLFSYTMKAFGMSDMLYAKALVKKLLNEGVTDKSAMANQMTNPLYKDLATAFDFSGKGPGLTSALGFADAVVAKFVQATMETNEGKDNEGVRLALYFKRKASSFTKPMEILADKAALKFIQTTFGIPKEASGADIDTQVRQISKLLDMKDLQDPEKVDRLIQRFSAMYDMSNGMVQKNNPMMSLFDTSNQDSGFGLDLMMSIATLPRGGF